jgi:hypothetical protein
MKKKSPGATAIATRAPPFSSAQARGRLQRHRIGAAWDTVWRMLTDPKAPRRDAQGRDVYEAWCDLVLENPGAEIARVIKEILPPIPLENQGVTPGLVANIQSLYLTAVQAANAEPKLEQRVIDVAPQAPSAPNASEPSDAPSDDGW